MLWMWEATQNRVRISESEYAKWIPDGIDIHDWIPASGLHWGWLPDPVAHSLPAAHTPAKHSDFRQTVAISDNIKVCSAL